MKVSLFDCFSQKSLRGMTVLDVATPEIGKYLIESGIARARERSPSLLPQRSRVMRSRSLSAPGPPGRRGSASPPSSSPTNGFNPEIID